MIPRLILGPRLSGGDGLFVSRPGVSAEYATDDDLMLGLTRYTEQLIMIGATSSLPAYIPFGYTNVPFVFLTATGLTVSIGQGSGNEYNGNYSNVSGLFMRPYPPIGTAVNNVQADISAAGMSIYSPGGGGSVAAYAVYRRRIQ